ncbi:hypothetical protein [Iningainema tapete]|uniref:Uncharacterized protein n=1 Tax=Iningainema tapete BLCC-T55 TaxID=2748662 RepID=A0A8J6XJF3_9CYAN|nr:hypothetical protein [Iningainema tapete]MBD2775628.1 hypothetical protein [Iningainema tapete BLCC-T55]
MIICADTYIPFPRPLVYATYRDKLVELVPYLPNVRRIEVKSRFEQSGVIHFVNEWHGDSEIPVVARAVLSEAMLKWTDISTWNESEFTTEWRIKTHAFTEAVYCAGKNRFLEYNGGTLIESRGELTIDTKQIKGIPQLLASVVGRTVEDFLSKNIEPNLHSCANSVRLYLEESIH